MTLASDRFWKRKMFLFDKFNKVYLFGSALNKCSPRDIDLVLIYENNYSSAIAKTCDEIKIEVFQQFGIPAHLTILSTFEELQTQFVEQIQAVQIK